MTKRIFYHRMKVVCLPILGMTIHKYFINHSCSPLSFIVLILICFSIYTFTTNQDSISVRVLLTIFVLYLIHFFCCYQQYYYWHYVYLFLQINNNMYLLWRNCFLYEFNVIVIYFFKNIHRHHIFSIFFFSFFFWVVNSL